MHLHTHAHMNIYVMPELVLGREREKEREARVCSEDRNQEGEGLAIRAVWEIFSLLCLPFLISVLVPLGRYLRVHLLWQPSLHAVWVQVWVGKGQRGKEVGMWA